MGLRQQHRRPGTHIHYVYGIKMIKHIVLLTWKPETTKTEIDAVSQGLARLPEDIPEIVSYHFGPDAKLYRGNADYALVAEFRCEADLKTYVTHPSHQRFMKEVASPILDTFQSVQIEF
ncbi:MAG: stress protein [Spongiibacter sp.]|nr:stress protein [Spongiibacter sp.]|tara:strand:+ start:2178 stop:2534 length:357 start_codon:yes stop_codon:yes gene_type:complete